MPAATITGNGRSQVQSPLDPKTLFYTPQPDGQGGYVDGWAELEDVTASLETAYSYITAAESPFNAGTLINHLINTTTGPVSFVLPANPNPNQRYRIAPAAQTFETNPVTLVANGNPIAGQADDINLDQNGLAVEVVFVDATYGWAIIPRGETLFLQRTTLQGADVTAKRVDNNVTTVTSPSDLETLVLCTSDTDGSVELFDSTQVNDLFQMSFVQQGAGAKTFTLPTGSSDQILAVDNAVLTAGPGALVQAIKLVDGLWLISGGLI